MPVKINWEVAIKPLLKKYKKKPHPLQHNNLYECLVMVVLSAQSSDDYINKIAPALFDEFPNLSAMAKASDEDIYPFVKGVVGHAKKIKYLLEIARQLKRNENIPITMDALIALPGIGRKSANVIMREAGVEAEGIVVDLHTTRVATRLGISKSDDPKKIEQDCMKKIDEKDWSEAGMAMSFLGREICRPKPLCPECLMNEVCQFYLKGGYEKLQKELAKGKKAGVWKKGRW